MHGRKYVTMQKAVYVKSLTEEIGFVPVKKIVLLMDMANGQGGRRSSGAAGPVRILLGAGLLSGSRVNGSTVKERYRKQFRKTEVFERHGKLDTDYGMENVAWCDMADVAGCRRSRCWDALQITAGG